MLISFVGVLTIALSKPIAQQDQQAKSDKIIGSICSLTVASCYALVSVLTRKMQAIHYSIVLFYYAIFSVVALSLILLIESAIN